MPLGRMRHLQAVIGRVYHLLTKEAAYGPNLHHMDDFRAAQKLEKSLDSEIVSEQSVASAEPREAREAVSGGR
jgi:hypothetical protein